VSHESSGTKLLPKTSPGTKNGKVVDFNMAEANIKWFVDAKVNITKIVLTDTLPKKDKTAIILNRTTLAKKHYIFPILNYTNVCKMANVLREQGEKGDRFVSIYR
jgi:acetyl-CoA synthetase